MSKIIKCYIKDLKEKKIDYNEKQRFLIRELNQFYKNFNNINIFKKNIFFSNIFNSNEKQKNKGIYIWGDVGRGKTYLLDMFFNCVNNKKKIRLHYVHFIKLINNKLNEFSGKTDPLKFIAKWIENNYTLICLDEFFVKDITEAMQLSLLFEYIINLNIYFVITSNTFPDNLYENGLQRQKFIKTINIIKNNFKIIKIENNKDYRYKEKFLENFFLYPLSIKNLKKMKLLFINFSKKIFKKKININILNRKILAKYEANNLIWFDFNIICGDGRSQLDYIEIISKYDIIFISGIKDIIDDDIAKRFISLIDEIYDKKKKIILISKNIIENMYKNTNLSLDFKRTSSRIHEMTTQKYFNKNVL